MARLVNTKTKASFAVRVHTKKPSYFDGSEKRKRVTIDGQQMEMVLHPKRESSNRVNFQSLKDADTWLFVDNDDLRDAVLEAKNGALSFEIAEGRQKKAEAKAEATAA